ncbi:MAG: ABC transporter permease [Clostridiales bacterium]|nr:ABC transporter permease [Clostridiales bacterium]
MNTKLVNFSLIKYELRNISGNIFTIIFGVFFPILMSSLLSPVFIKDVPEEYKSIALTSCFISFSCIIPLATVFIGYSAVFSQELQNNIPIRIKLFGYTEKTFLFSKISANLIFVTISFFIYSIVNYFVLDIKTPTLFSGSILIISLYILTIILFILAHGIAIILKKFAPTYAITMVLYFAIMILSGMFGVTPDSFPKVLQSIAYTFPTTYICNDFIDFWNGSSYNFAPFIQSTLFFLSVSLLVLFYGVYKNRRSKQ